MAASAIIFYFKKLHVILEIAKKFSKICFILITETKHCTYKQICLDDRQRTHVAYDKIWYFFFKLHCKKKNYLKKI